MRRLKLSCDLHTPSAKYATTISLFTKQRELKEYDTLRFLEDVEK